MDRFSRPETAAASALTRLEHSIRPGLLANQESVPPKHRVHPAQSDRAGVNVCRSAPVGQQLRGLRLLIDRYRDVGLRDLSFDFYPDGRHEMLNEINRRHVQICLLGWIDQLLDKVNGDRSRVSPVHELPHQGEQG